MESSARNSIRGLDAAEKGQSPHQRTRSASEVYSSLQRSQHSCSIREGVAVGEFVGAAESYLIREHVAGGRWWKARRHSRELLAAASGLVAVAAVESSPAQQRVFVVASPESFEPPPQHQTLVAFATAESSPAQQNQLGAAESFSPSQQRFLVDATESSDLLAVASEGSSLHQRVCRRNRGLVAAPEDSSPH